MRESIPFDYQAKNREYIKTRNEILAKHERGEIFTKTYFDGVRFVLACKSPDTDTVKYSWTVVESFIPKLSLSKTPTVNRSNNAVETVNPLLTKNTVTIKLSDGENTPEALKDKVSQLLTDMSLDVSYRVRVVNKFTAAITASDVEAANKIVGVFETTKPFEGKFKIAVI